MSTVGEMIHGAKDSLEYKKWIDRSQQDREVPVWNSFEEWQRWAQAPSQKNWIKWQEFLRESYAYNAFEVLIRNMPIAQLVWEWYEFRNLISYPAMDRLWAIFENDGVDIELFLAALIDVMLNQDLPSLENINKRIQDARIHPYRYELTVNVHELLEEMQWAPEK